MNIKDRLVKLQIKNAKRIGIYSKLARFLANGVPLLKALETLYTHESKEGKEPNKPVAIMIGDIIGKLKNGDGFSFAMKKWAKSNELTLLEAGEVSGQLDKSLDDLVYIYEAQTAMRSALWGLAYPFALIISTFFYLYIFGSKVVPAFADIVPIEKWNSTGKRMVLLADFATNQLWIVALVSVFMIAISIYSAPRLTGGIRKYLDKIPPWSIYKINTGCSFLVSLSSLLNAGVPTPEAVLILSRNASPWYFERLVGIRIHLLNGSKNIGEAMAASGLDFPSKDLVIDIRSYADLDGFEELLEKFSRQWLRGSVEKIKLQIAFLKNTAIVFMGVMFMWIVDGIFELQNIVSSNAGG